MNKLEFVILGMGKKGSRLKNVEMKCNLEFKVIGNILRERNYITRDTCTLYNI